jgi:hypothetical protein
MSGSDPGDKDEPIRRDPFAAMMARLNEQLTRDVEQTARTYAARAESEPQEEGAEAPPATRPAAEAKPEAAQRTGRISDSTRAQISAEAMARATEAMRNAGRGGDDDILPTPQGLLQRLAQRKRLMIGLGVGFVFAAAASVGVSFLLPSSQPPVRGDRADPAAAEWPKDTPPSTAAAPAEPPAPAQEPAPAPAEAPQPPPAATATATAPVTPPPAPQPPPVAPAPGPVAAAPAPVPAATPPAPPPPTGTPSCPAARQALGLCVPVVH